MHSRAEWPFLSDKFLFTADITKPFQVTLNEKPLVFDVITAWEVMEHLPEERLDIVCRNIYNHLEEHGLAIMSISTSEETIRGQKLHLTVKDKDFWSNVFESNNLINLGSYSRYFNTQYVRGAKQNAPGSFHMFLSRNPSKAPACVKLKMKEWLMDRWSMSKAQKALSKLICKRLI